jgi:hypothetical protein
MIVTEVIPEIIKDIVEDLDFEEPSVAHLVPKDDIMNGYINGVPVLALCGVRFIPTRDPHKFPLCQACKNRIQELNK